MDSHFQPDQHATEGDAQKLKVSEKTNHPYIRQDVHIVLLVPIGVKCSEKGIIINDDRGNLLYYIDRNNTGSVGDEALEPNLEWEEGAEHSKKHKTVDNWLDMFIKTALRDEDKELGMFKNITVVIGINGPRSLSNDIKRIIQEEVNGFSGNVSGINCKVFGFVWDCPWRKASLKRYQRPKNSKEFFEKIQDSIKGPDVMKAHIDHETASHRNLMEDLVPYSQILDRIKSSKQVKNYIDEVAAKPKGIIAFCIGHAEIQTFNQALSCYIDRIVKQANKNPLESLVITPTYIYPKPLEASGKFYDIYVASQVDRIIRISMNEILPGSIYFPEPGLCFTLGRGTKSIPNFSTSSERGSNESVHLIRNLKPHHFVCETNHPITIKVRRRVQEKDFPSLQIPQSHLKPLYCAKNIFINHAIEIHSTEVNKKNNIDKRNTIISKIMKVYYSTFKELLKESVLKNTKSPSQLLSQFKSRSPENDQIEELVKFTSPEVAQKIVEALKNSAFNSLLYLMTQRCNPKELIKEKLVNQDLQKIYEWTNSVQEISKEERRKRKSFKALKVVSDEKQQVRASKSVPPRE